MIKINVVTPASDNPTDKELCDIVGKDINNTIKTENRLKIIKIIYGKLGFKLDPDSALALLSEDKVQLYLACAGSGKTTLLTVKSLLEKIYRNSRIDEGKKVSGDRMLCLVYNNSNVKDVRDRHAFLVSKLCASNLTGFGTIDHDLNVRTFHGFCGEWLRTCAAEVGIVNCSLMTTEEQEEQMRAAVSTVAKDYSFDAEDVSIKGLLNIYNLSRELMCSIEDLEDTDKFMDLHLTLNQVNEILDSYQSLKNLFNQYDFTDELVLFYKLITTNEDVANRIRSCYEYIMADECQDVTPLLMKILKVISRDCPLICVGDDDQSIYEFRGASSDNVLNFGGIFPEHKAFLLRTNRRCPSNFVAMGSALLSMNKKRYDKEMRAINSDGKVKFIPYRDKISQYNAVAKMISEMSEEERNNTCLCYRNKRSSMLLSDILAQYPGGISFRVYSGYEPYSYKLYGVVLDVLRALYNKHNKKILLNLFKCLPITKKEMAKILNVDPRTGESLDDSSVCNLKKLDLGDKKFNNKFMYYWDNLMLIADNIDVLPMENYFDALFECIVAFYWKSTSNFLRLDPIDDTEYQLQIKKLFTVKETFLVVDDKIRADLRRLRSAKSTGTGVVLSTFHKLKGLEFDNVILVDLKEEIFPNFAYIQDKEISDDQKQNLCECETRLAYVAVTRAKKTLTFYYSKQDPSVYVNVLIQLHNDAKIAKDLATHEGNVESITASESFTKQKSINSQDNERQEAPQIMPKRNKNPLIMRLYNGN